MAAQPNDPKLNQNELAIIRFINALKTEKQEVREDAFNRLLRMKSQAVIPLVTELASPNRNARLWTVVLLGEIRDSRAVDALSSILSNDLDAEIRAYAAHALGLIGDPQAVGLLIHVLQKENEHVWVRERAAWALGVLGDSQAVAALIKALMHDRSSAVQASAAESLGLVGSEVAVEPLLQALMDNQEVEVFADAGTALQRIGEKRVVGPLIDALLKRPEATIWSLVVIELLGSLADRRALPALEWLRSNQPRHTPVPDSFNTVITGAMRNIETRHPQ